MNKNLLKTIIIDQKNIFFKKIDSLIKRDLTFDFINSNKIVVITGIRRCGKSTLLKQISDNYENFSFLNFEDERLLNFNVNDFQEILEVFLEINPKTNVFFFDEIQNITFWEKFVRRLFDMGKKVFITGSNSKLLRSDIASSLTGRYLKIELYPFSLKEYLVAKRYSIKKIYTTEEKAILIKHLNDYINNGGFPEVVLSNNPQELVSLYQDILIKDIIVRHKIKDIKEFRELSLFMLSNVTNKISFNNLKKILSFSTTSKVKNYIDFLSEAYLFFNLPKFDYSIKKQVINDKKIYCIDNGLINVNSFYFSENLGKLLENMVFLELKRKKFGEIYYYKGKKECDFVVKDKNRITMLFQVCLNLSDIETKEREINGLLEALNFFKLEQGIIITLDEKSSFNIENKKIVVLPIYEFLLNDSYSY